MTAVQVQHKGILLSRVITDITVFDGWSLEIVKLIYNWAKESNQSPMDSPFWFRHWNFLSVQVSSNSNADAVLPKLIQLTKIDSSSGTKQAWKFTLVVDPAGIFRSSGSHIIMMYHYWGIYWTTLPSVLSLTCEIYQVLEIIFQSLT